MRVKKVFDVIFLFFLIGSGLLVFFLILSGAKETGTLARFYWIKADTSGIPNAQSETFWTNYRSCGKMSGNFVNCSGTHAAYPFSPRDNFPSSSAVLPSAFVNHRNTYYYLSRVGWATLLIGLFFLMVTVIPTILSLFLSFTSILISSSVFIWFAWFFVTLAACLLTSVYVKGRNNFRNSGRSSKLGVDNFAFLWTSVFLLTMCAIWHPVSTILHKRMMRNKTYAESSPNFYDDNNLDYYPNTEPAVIPPPSTTAGTATAATELGANPTTGSRTGVNAYQDINNTNKNNPPGSITKPSDYSGFTSNSPLPADLSRGGAGGAGVARSGAPDMGAQSPTSALNVPFQNKDRSFSEQNDHYADVYGNADNSGNRNFNNPIKNKSFKSSKKNIPETDTNLVTEVHKETTILSK